MKHFKRYVAGLLCALMLIATTGCTAPEQDTQAQTDSRVSAEQAQPSTSLRFYLVRHGQTYTNMKELSVASARSAPLTEKGRTYAYYAGLGLKAENTEFMAAYCSPLNRTYETATYILSAMDVDMDITVEPNVIDINAGEMEATYPDEYMEQFGRDGSDFSYFFGTIEEPDYASPIEGAETTYELAQRFEEGLRNIAAQHEGESGNILVTTHSTIGFYTTKFTGCEPHAVPNTSVTLVDYTDGEFHLVEEGDTSYMETGEKIYSELQDLEIYLVTSPQTLLQSRALLEGGMDSVLTEAGQASAAKVSDIIGDTPVAIYSSNQGRSRAARALTYPDASDIVETQELNELFLGIWEGEKNADLQNNEAQDYAKLKSTDSILTLTPRDAGGEQPMYASGRLDAVLQDIAFHYQASEGKVVVFTHPYIIKCYLNATFPDQQVQVSDNAQIVKLTYKNNAFFFAEMQDIV